MTLSSLLQRLSQKNEAVWLSIASVSDVMGDQARNIVALENAIRVNPSNANTVKLLATAYTKREQFHNASELIQRWCKMSQSPPPGELLAVLGYCFLMLGDLHASFSTYQHALYLLPNQKDPQLWFGIGILYEKFGALDHAEDAYMAAAKIDTPFEKQGELYFRLGVVNKHKGRLHQSLEYFKTAMNLPNSNIANAPEVFCQAAVIYEMAKEYHSAKEMYETGLKMLGMKPVILQNLAWLYINPFHQVDAALSLLMLSVENDKNGEHQSWYNVGRFYLAIGDCSKAHHAYQQAVFTDERDPVLWCSIGILYFKIQQFKEALDAFTTAIRINPAKIEVWYNLGSLYEMCKQPADALDAFQRCLECDPAFQFAQFRIHLMQTGQPFNRQNDVPDCIEPLQIPALTYLQRQVLLKSQGQPAQPPALSAQPMMQQGAAAHPLQQPAGGIPGGAHGAQGGMSGAQGGMAGAQGGMSGAQGGDAAAAGNMAQMMQNLQSAQQQQLLQLQNQQAQQLMQMQQQSQPPSQQQVAQIQQMQMQLRAQLQAQQQQQLQQQHQQFAQAQQQSQAQQHFAQQQFAQAQAQQQFQAQAQQHFAQQNQAQAQQQFAQQLQAQALAQAQAQQQLRPPQPQQPSAAPNPQQMFQPHELQQMNAWIQQQQQAALSHTVSAPAPAAPPAESLPASSLEPKSEGERLGTALSCSASETDDSIDDDPDRIDPSNTVESK